MISCQDMGFTRRLKGCSMPDMKRPSLRFYLTVACLGRLDDGGEIEKDE